jgi:hypothetical protein
MDETEIKLLLIEIVKELTEQEIKELTFSNKLLSSSLLEVNHRRFVAGLC